MGPRRPVAGRARRCARGMRCAWAVAATMLLAALCAQSAQAAWLEPVELSQGGAVRDQRAAVGADGSITVVWRQLVGGAQRVAMRRLDARGRAGAVTIISPEGGDVGQDWLRVVPQGDGAVVSWQQESRLWVARIGAGGAAGTPEPASPSGLPVGQSAQAAGSGGHVVAAWTARDTGAPADGQYQVLAARITPGGAIGPAQQVAKGRIQTGDPTVAVAPDGAALVAWRTRYDDDPADLHTIEAARIAAGGGIGEPFSFSLVTAGEDPNAHAPSAGMAADGTAWVTWYQNDDMAPNVWVAKVSAAGVPGSPHELAPPGAQQTQPQLVVGPDGTVTVMHRSNAGVRMHRIPPGPGVDPEEPVTLPGSSAVSNPRLTVDHHGVVTAAWLHGATPFDVVATRVSPDGDTGPPDTVVVGAVADGISLPMPSAGAGGDVGLAWRSLDGSGHRIDLAVFDGAAPRVTTTGSVAAVAGTPVTLAATVSDRSPVTVRWEPGDATPVRDGASVEHAYATPGAYTATVTATDAQGRSASAQVPVTVAPAPVPAAPGDAGADPGAGGGAAPVDAPPADTAAPRLGALRVTPARAVAGRTRTLAITFRLDEAARVRATVERRAAGRRARGRCVAPTAALVRARARTCARWVTVGTLARSADAGAGRMTVTRLRVGRRILGPGRYRVRVVATDAPGNRSAARTAAFRVVPRVR